MDYKPVRSLLEEGGFENSDTTPDELFNGLDPLNEKHEEWIQEALDDPKSCELYQIINEEEPIFFSELEDESGIKSYDLLEKLMKIEKISVIERRFIMRGNEPEARFETS